MKRLLSLSAALVCAAALHAQAPDIAFEGNINFLKFPANIYLGEAAGVATTSKGNVLVYTRTGENMTLGGSRFFTHGGSRLFEFDPTGKYVREIGAGIYGFLYAQSVRVDAQDNIWTVDRASDNIIRFDPSGRFVQVLSRKPESINLPGGGGGGEGGGGRGAAGGGRGAGGRGAAGGSGRGGRGGRLPGEGTPGDSFNRPTDIAFDPAGNMFVTDAYTNARVVKLDKNGRYMMAWGSRGSGEGQFDMPNSVAVDGKGNVYVADLNNKRIQVFDNDGKTLRPAIAGVGSPSAICISPGAHQYLYSSNSNATDSMENGEIYKLELDGTVLGKFGKAGKGAKEFGTVNEIDCRMPNTLLVGEVTNWRVQKITLH